MSDLTEPPSVQGARHAIARYDVLGICPSVDRSSNPSSWTCTECKRVMPPTVGTVSQKNYGVRLPVRCPLWKDPLP